MRKSTKPEGKFSYLINAKEAVMNGLAFLVMTPVVAASLNAPVRPIAEFLFVLGLLGGSMADVKYFLKAAKAVKDLPVLDNPITESNCKCKDNVQEKN